MARGFSGSSRGSFGSRGGARQSSGSKGAGSKGAGSSQRRSAGSTSKPKGQVKSAKAVQYSVKDRHGKTKYIGTTNNPGRRASEHRESGKLKGGDKLVVETRAVTRKVAEGLEQRKLASHRRSHRGQNPQHNTTNDGSFHS